MLTYPEFEQWANQAGVHDREILAELYPLADNLWRLARQLEQWETEFHQGLRLTDLSTTATGD